jgi:HSP20 family protein
MTLIRCNTHNPIDRAFDHFNHGLFPFFNGFTRGETEMDVKENSRLPRTNIDETDDKFVFSMEMPGLTKKDVEVSLEKDVLLIKGERTEKTEEKNLLRREIRSMKFERSFKIGDVVEQGNIKAKMENGLLTVILPKKPEKVGRKVDVV